ncbi:DUF1365 domain-containing protein [Brevundimonas sp. FT23028]|uniref:DUF1365 domain-containing protein n=1 Tax=Brevundimonas sp. FT23028 TaxID=3393748 RepID=UPI003B58AAF1
MTAAGSLYRGAVMHRRARPRVHAFRYRLFWILLDLDRLDEAARPTRLFSIGRFNLLSFQPRDHGDGSAVALRDQARAKLEAAGIADADGPIRLLTLPRVLGFVFNPISVYYAGRADGGLAGVIYEVTSTFGERRAYVLRADGGALFRHGCEKTLHVSPFLTMDMTYAFRGKAPDDLMQLTIDGHDADGLVIATAMQGERRPLRDREILKAALALPLETLKVVAAIHWEALRLWLKGVPPAPDPKKASAGGGTTVPAE